VIRDLYFIVFALFLVVMSVILKYFYVILFYCTIIAFDNDAIKEATYLLTYLLKTAPA